MTKRFNLLGILLVAALCLFLQIRANNSAHAIEESNPTLASTVQATVIFDPLLVEKDNLFGFIDRTGKVVIPLQFDNALPFSDGLAPVWIGGGTQWGYIDRTGKKVIQPQFE